ncbi:glycosyltransferase family 4 protein [Cupriavidus sp. PET2-C1]
MPSVMVDGYNLGLEKGTGVATYGSNLCKAARSVGYRINLLYGGRSTRSKNPLLSEIAFFDGAMRKKAGIAGIPRMVGEAFSAPLGCRVDEVPISGGVLYDSLKTRLPNFDRLWNSPDLYKRSHRAFRWFNRFASVALPQVDIAHWTYPLPIRAKGALNIYTLHDLVPLRLPHTTLDHKRNYFALCKRLVDTADHIITVSETSRKDIINLLDADPDKVTNTFQSVSLPKAATEKSEATVRQELSGIFNLSYKGYFLFFGAIEPKKNINRLIEAYLGSGVNLPLVVVGAPGWKSEEELRLLKTIGALPGQVQSRILRLEYLPLPLLITIIRGAKATVFPSLYEGFGLPVLESMTLGTAVITSRIGSLLEVAGDACSVIDPYDTRALAQAMRAIDTNDDLRRSLEEKGVRQALQFNPEAYAKRIDEVYRLVVEKRRLSTR